MSLSEQLNRDLMVSMKARDEDRVRVIRLLRGRIRDLEIAKKRKLNEDELTGVLTHSAKQRKDSIDAYKKGKREDLASQEELELNIIQTYLPKALSQQELESVVSKVIEETGAQTLKDLGKVMPKVMSQVRGRANGAEVQAIVRSKLS